MKVYISNSVWFIIFSKIFLQQIAIINKSLSRLFKYMKYFSPIKRKH